MTPFTVYDPNTGRILRSGIAPNDAIATMQAIPENHESVLLALSDELTQYVDVGTGTVAYKPGVGGAIDKTEVVADMVDAVTITGIDSEAMVTVSGPNPTFEMMVLDGVMVLTFESAGEYQVEVSKDMMVPQTFTVTATEPSM